MPCCITGSEQVSKTMALNLGYPLESYGMGKGLNMCIPLLSPKQSHSDLWKEAVSTIFQSTTGCCNVQPVLVNRTSNISKLLFVERILHVQKKKLTNIEIWSHRLPRALQQLVSPLPIWSHRATHFSSNNTRLCQRIPWARTCCLSRKSEIFVISNLSFLTATKEGLLQEKNSWIFHSSYQTVKAFL